MTYRKYKYNVIQAWVEIPEVYDELWERHFESEKKFHRRNSISNKKKQYLDVESEGDRRSRAKSFTRKRSNSLIRRNSGYLWSRSYDDMDLGVGEARKYSFDERFTDLTKARLTPSPMKGITGSPIEGSCYAKNSLIKVEEKHHGSFKKGGWTMLKNKHFRETTSKSSNTQQQHENLGKQGSLIQPLSNNRKKFNYEKYLKYLEINLETIGYRIAGVMVTWDRASFFTVILITLVGVFAQAAFLK